MKNREIKAARIRLGISAHEMATAMDITDDSYYKKERGDSKFSIDEVPVLTEKLKFSPHEMNDVIFNGKLPIG